jgi:hypothetical protein
MTERQVQTTVGVLFIISHFAILVLVAAFYIARGFTFEEMTTTISIVAPVFAGYTLIIVRAIIADRNNTSSGAHDKPSAGLFVFLSLFVPIVFVTLLAAIIVLRAYNLGITSFEQFKTMLALIEGTFAVYLGPIVQALFSAGRQAADAPPVASANDAGRVRE